MVLPGGFGTLDELTEALALIQTGKAPRMPIILVGSGFWQGMLDWIRRDLVGGGMIEARGFAPSSDEREGLLTL